MSVLLFRNSAVVNTGIEFQNATAAVVNVAETGVINVPAGTVNGDFLLLLVTVPQGLVGGVAVNPTVSGSWTQAATINGGGVQDITGRVFWRRASSEPASYTVTLGTSYGDYAALTMLRFKGVVSSGNPLRTTGTVFRSTLGSPQTSVALTGVQSTDLAIHVAHVAKATWNSADYDLAGPGGSWVERGENVAIATDPIPATLAVTQFGTGAAPTFAATGTGATNTIWAFVALALIEDNPVSGFLANTAPPVGGSFAGHVQTDAIGTLAATLPLPQVAVTAEAVASGTTALTAPAATASMAGSVIAEGPLSVIPPMPTASASGTVTASGSLSVTSSLPTVQASGTGSVTGTASITALAPTATASGTVAVAGGLAVAPASLPTASFTGLLPYGLDLVLRLPDVVFNAEFTNHVSVAPPMPMALIDGEAVVSGATALTLPFPSGAGAGTVTAAGALGVAPQLLTLTTSGTVTVTAALNVTAPAVSATAAGTTTVTATLDAVAPAASAAVSGTSTVSGALDVAAPAATFVADLTLSANGPLPLTLPAFTVVLDGHVAAPGTLNVFAPKLTATASGTVTVTAVLNAVAPLPQFTSVSETRVFGPRVVVVADEPRILYVPREDRTIRVPEDDRTLIVTD